MPRLLSLVEESDNSKLRGAMQVFEWLDDVTYLRIPDGLEHRFQGT